MNRDGCAFLGMLVVIGLCAGKSSEILAIVFVLGLLAAGSYVSKFFIRK